MLEKENKRDEKGLSSLIAVGVSIVIIFVSSSLILSGMRYYQTKSREAEEERDKRISKTIQSGLEIENVVYYTTDDNLKIISKNTGSTVLHIPAVQVLLDGKIVPEENIRTKLVNGVDTDVWIPGENLKIRIENRPLQPNRVKLVADYGVSDYFTKVENKV